MLKIKTKSRGELAVEFSNNERTAGTLNGQEFTLNLIDSGDGRYHIIRNHKSYNVELIAANFEEKSFTIAVNGTNYELEVRDRFDELLKNLGMDNLAAQAVKEVKAPMPGLVLDIAVTPGGDVKKGDPVLVLEAMKMENVLKSPTDGTIKSISVDQGDAVEKNQVLIHFE